MGTRSRNYPSMSLPEALDRLRKFYASEGKARVDAETAVRSWGYGSVNGASMRSLAAMRQYGLLEGSNEAIHLTDVGLALMLEPEQSADFQNALSVAIHNPAAFEQLWTEYGPDLPSDSAIVSYLVRKQNFSESAAKDMLKSFNESVAYVTRYTALPVGEKDNSGANVSQTGITPSNTMKTKEIQIAVPSRIFNFQWSLSENTVLNVSVSGQIPPEDDLEMIDQVLQLAGQQITKEVRRANRKPETGDSGNGKEIPATEEIF